jgi:hypothetical protein
MTKAKVSKKALRAEAEARVDLFMAIGEFIFEFSQLEFTIRHLLASALDLKGDKSFDAIVSPYDFRTLSEPASLTEKTAQFDPGVVRISAGWWI